MASTIRLDVVTPERVVYSKEISLLVAPAIDGEIGILPKHIPLVTGLKIGVLRIKKDEAKTKIAISDGFMEVQPDQINVVVKTAELPHEIDLERAERAKQRAEKRLKFNNNEIDYPRAEVALKKALARLQALKHDD